jgi:RNA polymerase sigma-70 factor (ECF subfamily)
MAAYDRDEVEAGDRAADAALVARAKGGDAPAFEDLYRRHAARLYALCVRLTGDPGLAEEVTQDVFVIAWWKLGEYRGESALGSWLHRIAVNEVLGVYRARRRRHAWMEAFRWFRGADQPASGGQAGLRVDLETAMARLPDGARTVFVLHDVEGYRHEEIALMLGIAPGTCKAQLHNARLRLRKELDQ